jgi:hypothetical protein
MPSFKLTCNDTPREIAMFQEVKTLIWPQSVCCTESTIGTVNITQLSLKPVRCSYTVDKSKTNVVVSHRSLIGGVECTYIVIVEL